jgi:cyclic pyranopterin phosphate synthase
MGKARNKKRPPRDSFRRQIDYLRVSITDRCNLSCVYCSPKRKKTHFASSELLTLEEIARFVRTACRHGLRKVRITGGEPLLRDDVVEIVSAIKASGVPDISLTTNGVLLARAARELKAAGLDRVNISLDTLNPVRYSEMTGGGDINRVWEAIDEAEATGLSPVKINVVPIRGINDEEVVDFASLTLGRDFHIRFIEYMPVGRTSICLKGVCVKKDELMEKISALGNLRKLPFMGKGPSRNYRLEGAEGIIGFISPISEHFCDSCNRLRLSPSGMIKPCLLSDIQIDIRTPMRRGITDKGLEELFLKAVSVKPEKHKLSEQGALADLPPMSEIGG